MQKVCKKHPPGATFLEVSKKVAKKPTHFSLESSKFTYMDKAGRKAGNRLPDPASMER